MEQLSKEQYYNEITKGGELPIDEAANEEMQQALKSADNLERPLSPEEQKIYEKLKLGATNVIKCFALKRSLDNKKGENLLIVTDSGADELMVRAMYEAGREIAGNDCRIMVAPKTEHAAQEFGEAIGEKMQSVDALLLITSLSRTHSTEIGNVLHPAHDADLIESIFNSEHLQAEFSNLRKFSAEELANKLSQRKLDEESAFPSKARLISITNTTRDILTVGGALEDPIEMAQRIDKMAEVMQGAEKVRITSENGTNLELDIKVPSLIKESGVIDRPGQAANFPSGEYAGSVDLAGTSGVYVVDGAVGMIGKVDAPIKITIENGVAVKIEGGESAEKLKGILEKANLEHKARYPEDATTDAFKLAEFAFGMNSKAFRYDEAGNKVSPPTSLEAEKGLGTIHIALGKNTIFNVPKNDPDYNDIGIHIDCVAMKTSITGIKENGEEIELIKNGEMVCL